MRNPLGIQMHEVFTIRGAGLLGAPCGSFDQGRPERCRKPRTCTHPPPGAAGRGCCLPRPPYVGRLCRDRTPVRRHIGDDDQRRRRGIPAGRGGEGGQPPVRPLSGPCSKPAPGSRTRRPGVTTSTSRCRTAGCRTPGRRRLVAEEAHMQAFRLGQPLCGG